VNKLEIYGEDLIIGEFVASNFNCYLASFESDGVRDEDTGIAVETIEEFYADNPVPVYLGQKYSEKLHPVAVLTKDSCKTTEDYFSEYECRAIIRLVTGQRGYQWMRIIPRDIGEDLWYKVRVTNVGYQKVNGLVAGIKLEMECDSMFAWSAENRVIINAAANTPFTVYNNSDDLYVYTYPYVEIVPKASGDLIVTNSDDNNWEVRLQGVRADETIRYDCKHEIIDGSRNDSGTAMTMFLDYSNCHFFRLKPERNTFTSNLAATFTWIYRVPRKVAFVTI